MQFDVSVQGAFYKTVSASNTGEALKTVISDIAAGLVTVNQAQPHNIVITNSTNPSSTNSGSFSQWAAVAPQNPSRLDTWSAPDGTRWVYDQPRGADGRYLSDDPNTAEKESALQWQPYTA